MKETHNLYRAIARFSKKIIEAGGDPGMPPVVSCKEKRKTCNEIYNSLRIRNIKTERECLRDAYATLFSTPSYGDMDEAFCAFLASSCGCEVDFKRNECEQRTLVKQCIEEENENGPECNFTGTNPVSDCSIYNTGDSGTVSDINSCSGACRNCEETDMNCEKVRKLPYDDKCILLEGAKRDIEKGGKNRLNRDHSIYKKCMEEGGGSLCSRCDCEEELANYLRKGAGVYCAIAESVGCEDSACMQQFVGSWWFSVGGYTADECREKYKCDTVGDDVEEVKVRKDEIQ
jgi:hypothetical protein